MLVSIVLLCVYACYLIAPRVVNFIKSNHNTTEAQSAASMPSSRVTLQEAARRSRAEPPATSWILRARD
eukprot:3150563-Heterocapsa_arctica.AAC.1